MIVACDWDGTLVDKNQDWLPDAKETLAAWSRNGHKIVIHSCRANYPHGHDLISQKLFEAKLFGVRIWNGPGKPEADIYIDDRAHRFNGDWRETRRVI